MPERKTFKPISGTEKDFALVDYNRKNEKALHAIDASSSIIPISGRRAICEEEKRNPKTYIKDIIEQQRISFMQMQQILKDHEDRKEEPFDTLNELTGEEEIIETIPELTPDEFWMARAKVLFVSFPEDIDPEMLRPRVINEAYEFFFGS